MKKLKILGLTLVCGLTLAACGNDNSGVTVSSKSDTAETSQIESAESSEAEESTSAVGKRSNPVPLGQTGTFDTVYFNDNGDEIDANLSLTISNVVRGQEAYDYLVAANEFNNAAPEGQEWIIFDVELTVNSGSEDDPYFEMGSFIPVSSNGSEITQSDYPTFSDGEAFGLVDLYDGGTATGKYGFLIAEGDDALVEYTGNDLDTSVFFSLK